MDSLERQPLLNAASNYYQSSRRVPANEETFGSSLTKSLENIQKQIVEQQNAETDLKFGLTPVRRMFCLLSLFDFLLVFLLWIIYAQIFMEGLVKTFQEQVEKYLFKTSLFDFVVFAFLRCIVLLFVYALLKSNRWYMVATTTMLSTLMAILKVILNNGDAVKAGQPMSYFIIIATFILCWSETWHFDFQVIPTEIRLRRENASNTLTGSLPTMPSSVSNWRQGANSEYQSCYSPNAVTPQESDDESNSDDYNTFSKSDHHLDPAKRRYIEQGQDAVKSLLMMLHVSENWKKEKQGDDDILVEARTFNGFGKVYRCKCILECDARLLFKILWSNVESQPSWNPTVADCQIVSEVDKKTDICYVVASEAGGGLVSARDFVNVRRYQKQDNLMILAGKATLYEAIQERKGMIRGENGPGGYVIKCIANNQKHCEFFWFLNTDIKGWIPKSVIDQTMASVMVDTIRALRDHISKLPR